MKGKESNESEVLMSELNGGEGEEKYLKKKGGK